MHHFLRQGGIGLLAVSLTSLAQAQEIESRVLTDKIYRGDGVIDLLKNVNGSELSQYFTQTGGLLLLGADVNEDSSGNESSKSLGIAIKQAQLSITTSAGDFTFKDFMTSTSAMLRDAGGSSAGNYYTLFGQGGSSQITSTSNLDISKFDDVMWFENIAYQGEIKSAKLSITFLSTPTSRATEAESFFDFSGGFEDFALFNVADSVLLEKANIGMTEAPTGIKYEVLPDVMVALEESKALGEPGDNAATGDSSSGGSALGNDTPISVPPAAPAPPLIAAASMGLLLLWKKRKQATGSHA